MNALMHIQENKMENKTTEEQINISDYYKKYKERLNLTHALLSDLEGKIKDVFTPKEVNKTPEENENNKDECSSNESNLENNLKNTHILLDSVANHVENLLNRCRL